VLPVRTGRRIKTVVRIGGRTQAAATTGSVAARPGSAGLSTLLQQIFARLGAIWDSASAAPPIPSSATTSQSLRAAGHPAYRRDIDGLRALAVIPVVIYHMGYRWLSGGFVGVDIFFVISGYLISSIILGEVAAGNFSLARFYVRRIRRIVPALVVMIAGVFLLGYLALFPGEYKALADSALAATLSVSNIYFLHNTGYFTVHAGNEPLIHTWSLAVEEQFYVVFPLVVMLVHRFARRILTHTILLLGLASFAWSAYGVYADPEATFYLAHSRAWELLLGTIIAIQPMTLAVPSLIRNVMALAGLAMIAIAVTCFDGQMPFPGVNALLPCVGAALIIAAGQSGTTLVGELLSLRPVVFIGLISYSLYLWHWPMIFFQYTDSLSSGAFLPGSARLGLRPTAGLYGLVLSVLSWKFIEQPFRRARRGTPNTHVFAGGLLGLGATAALALLVMTTNGLPARFTPDAQRYAAYLDSGEAHLRGGQCFILDPYKFKDFDQQTCLTPVSGKQNDLLIGDSHAAHLWYGLSTELPSDIHVLQATGAGCPPQPDHRDDVWQQCNLLMHFVFDTYLPTHHIDRLLLQARWNAKDLPGLEATLAWAKRHAIPVTLFGPMLEYDIALPRIYAISAQTGKPAEPDKKLVNNRGLDKIMRSMAATHGVDYVSFWDALCDRDDCRAFSTHNPPLEFDSNHLTKEGSQLVIQKLIDLHELP
jgi:peptidoglycan/LPS O-acetylase OafA/YrhL